MGGGVSAHLSESYDNSGQSQNNNIRQTELVQHDIHQGQITDAIIEGDNFESVRQADISDEEQHSWPFENLQALQRLFVFGLEHELQYQQQHHSEDSPYYHVLNSISQMFLPSPVTDERLLTHSGDETDHIELRQNTLHIVTEWSLLVSHSCSLRFSPNCSSVSPASSDGHFPAALALCSGLLVALTVEMTRAPRRDSYFSFGLVAVPSDISSPFEVSGCIGKMPQTWGVADRRNNSQPAVVFAQGLSVGSMRSLVEGDQLSLYLDLRNHSPGFNAGLCHLLLNGERVHTFSGLSCMAQYAAGCTLCQDHCASLLDVDITEYVISEESRGAEPDLEGDLLPDTASDDMSSAEAAVTANAGRSAPTPAPAFFPRQMNVLARPPPKPAVEEPVGDCATESCDSKPKTAPDDSRLCCICLDEVKCVVLMPCKHLCVCDSCCGPRSGTLRSCPICRERVEHHFKVFL